MLLGYHLCLDESLFFSLTSGVFLLHEEVFMQCIQCLLSYPCYILLVFWRNYYCCQVFFSFWNILIRVQSHTDTCEYSLTFRDFFLSSLYRFFGFLIKSYLLEMCILVKTLLLAKRWYRIATLLHTFSYRSIYFLPEHMKIQKHVKIFQVFVIQ